jgi:hypothetical protein
MSTAGSTGMAWPRDSAASARWLAVVLDCSTSRARRACHRLATMLATSTRATAAVPMAIAL